MAERMIKANGVELCTEPFASPTDPAVLLVMGLGGSMLWWEDGFCRMLADAGRFVIRYDHRDTGRSVTYEPGRPGYTGADLITDAVSVLDGYGVAAAHVVGVSASGALAQLLALDFPTVFCPSWSSAAHLRRRVTAGSRGQPRSSAASSPQPQWTGRTPSPWSSTRSTTPACSQETDVRSTRKLAGCSSSATSSERGTSRRCKNHYAIPDDDHSDQALASITVPNARDPRHGRSHVSAPSR